MKILSRIKRDLKGLKFKVLVFYIVVFDIVGSAIMFLMEKIKNFSCGANLLIVCEVFDKSLSDEYLLDTVFLVSSILSFAFILHLIDRKYKTEAICFNFMHDLLLFMVIFPIIAISRIFEIAFLRDVFSGVSDLEYGLDLLNCFGFVYYFYGLIILFILSKIGNRKKES